MLYSPRLRDKEIKENHKIFLERFRFYKRKGLDFTKSRNAILRKARPLEGNILEIGAGRGHMSLCLAKAGYKFTAIDIDKEALKTAALNLAYEGILSRASFRVMDGRSLGFKNESFDNVVSVCLLHDVKGIRGILSEADRVLRKKGKLVLADFNKKALKIISNAHKEEGNTHTDSAVDKARVDSYFRDLGYRLNNYENTYYWILIGKKI